MAVSKSMDFPGAKKSSYAAQVVSHTSQVAETQLYPDSTLNFVPVPGPQGPPGPAGRDGERGEQGFTGHLGQQAGWASYTNSAIKPIKLGITQGDDGWVSVWLDTKDKTQNEKYMPMGCTSLWNSHQRMLNFHGIKEGSQVFITYNFELTTYTPNTEVWLRTYFASKDQEFVQFIGSLKYQNVYNLSATQQIFIEDSVMWGNGAIPQIRTDFDASVILNSIYVSVV